MLSSIFHVGQLVACFVVQVDDEKDGKGNKRIWLSLRLSLLYKGLTLDAVQDGMVLYNNFFWIFLLTELIFFLGFIMYSVYAKVYFWQVILELCIDLGYP